MHADERWIRKCFDFQGAGRCIRQHCQHLKFDRVHIAGLHDGWSYYAVACHVGHTNVTLARCWNQWVPEDTHTCREVSDLPRQGTSREDNCIVHQALQSPMMSGS